MIMMGDRKKQVAAILGPLEEKSKETAPEALHTIAEELMDAVHAKDPAGIASALRAAFLECDSEPHEEGPHTNED